MRMEALWASLVMGRTARKSRDFHHVASIMEVVDCDTDGVCVRVRV
jgi:hypothetical protein